MIRDIVVFPDPRLFKRSNTLDGLAAPTSLITDMLETMAHHGAAGLAAIQVGIPLAIMVVMGPEGRPIVMIDPKWKPLTTELLSMREGCLSFPGVIEKVSRFPEVMATYRTLAGDLVTEAHSGITAQAIQHEMEHLDGAVFIENLPIHRRQSVRQKMKQAQRRGRGEYRGEVR